MTHNFIKRFSFSPEQTHKIYGLIARIEELKGQWKAGEKLSPQTLKRLKQSVIVTSTGSSTRVEGAKLTDEQVEALLKGIKIRRLKTRDEQEVAGYAELLSNIFASYKGIKLTEGTVKHFHNELLKYSEKDSRHRGSYKFGSNRVEAKSPDGKVVGVLFDPTPPYLVEKEIKELVDFTNNEFGKKEIHPLMIIGNFVFEFLSIHPFQDGNGRASRILTNFLLLKNGYQYAPFVSHEKLIEDNKDAYYIALNKSQRFWKTDEEDIYSWFLFFFEVLLKQTEIAIKLLDDESFEYLLSDRQLKVWNYIQKHAKVTKQQIENDLAIPSPTILQVLNKLLRMKKIKRFGEGRATFYRIVS